MPSTAKAYSYIRFSSPEQEKGDSLRRQLEQAKNYCKKKGLILDESLNMTDKGLSAYKGLHRTKGALGVFLNLVESGKIEKGSVLIVENLDRLSREKVHEAFNQFSSIINAGIKLVTLQDGMEYDQKSIEKNWTQLIISITYMARAHEESLVKSKRLSEAWVNKRKKASNGEILLTSKSPDWLEVSEDKKRFIKIPEVCKAVELIFQKKLEGKGSYKIQRELNLEDNVWRPSKSKRNKSGGWRISYINKILRNRAVIGEYQPHRYITTQDEKGKNKRKRVPEGEPIQDYYPKIIDEGLFYQVQQILDVNSKKDGRGGGRKDKGSNLFSHVIKCGICGSSMQFEHKGSNLRYLRCDSLKRNNPVLIEERLSSKVINRLIGDKLNKRPSTEPIRESKEAICTSKAINYIEFERIFFDYFEELDISKLLPDQDEVKDLIKEKEKQLTANNCSGLDIEKQIENLLNMVSETSDKRNRILFDKKITEKRKVQEQLEIESKNIEKEISELREQKEKLIDSRDRLTEIYSYLGSGKDENENIDRRLQLRQEIQNMVEWIKIYPLEEEYREVEEIESGIIKHMESEYIDKIRIKFKGSSKLRVVLLKRYGEVNNE